MGNSYLEKSDDLLVVDHLMSNAQSQQMITTEIQLEVNFDMAFSLKASKK